jgi:Pyruvate/2-oxoacid:ferredoxin oxidoreductase gamma subunit
MQKKKEYCVLFWGLGGDGTVGANESIVNNSIKNEKHTQGYFLFSAGK